MITARLLGPSDRGLLSVLLTVVGIGTLVGGLGTNVALRVYLPKDPRVSVGGFFRLTRPLTLGVAVVLTPICFLVLHRMGHPPDIVLLALVILLIVTTFLSTQTLDVFNALHQSPRSARINTLGFVVTMVALLGLWWAGLGLHWVVCAYVLGFATRAVVSRSMIRVEPISVERDHTAARLMRNGLPLLGTNVGQAMMLRADQLMVGLVLGSHAAGMYAVAATPAGILTVIANSIGQPTFAEAAHGRLGWRGLARQLCLALLITLAAAGAGIVLMPWALPLLFGEDFAGSVFVAQLLLLAQVTLAPYLILSRAAAGYGLVRLAGAAGLGGAALLILTTSVMFVPIFGMAGAAMACIATFLIMDLTLIVGLAWKRPWPGQER
ncbi:lipopolysaccharide biosynthesis protein [Propionibacteriaceae bacterium Y1685]